MWGGSISGLKSVCHPSTVVTIAQWDVNLHSPTHVEHLLVCLLTLFLCLPQCILPLYSSKGVRVAGFTLIEVFKNMVPSVGSRPMSFFRAILDCSRTMCWKARPFPTDWLPWSVCGKPVDHEYVDVFLDPVFCSLGLLVCHFAKTSLSWKIWNRVMRALFFFFFESCFCYA